jgi:hypothetical protein
MHYALGDQQEDHVNDHSLDVMEHFIRIISYVNIFIRLSVTTIIFMVGLVIFHFIGITL